jgi:hypothetical protein
VLIDEFDQCTTTSQMASLTARHFARCNNPLLIQPIIIQCTRSSMREAVDKNDPRLLVHHRSGLPLFATLAGAALALTTGRV